MTFFALNGTTFIFPNVKLQDQKSLAVPPLTADATYPPLPRLAVGDANLYDVSPQQPHQLELLYRLHP